MSRRNNWALRVFAVVSVGLPGFAHAGAGIFGYGLELTGNGTDAKNNGMPQLYAFDNGGGAKLSPSSNATLNASAANDPPSLPYFLGSFSEITGDSLILNGSSILTYKNGGTNVSATYSNIQLYLTSGGANGSYTPTSLSFNYDNVGGTSGDQRWANESGTANMLTGLATGTYTIAAFASASSSDGTGVNLYDNNGGPNFGLSFYVTAPEPVSAVSLPLVGLMMIARRRRASVKPV